tara:strand:+ start:3431 stop:4015 length:585 start_codon:yes stop_codon:yes gene_type:complete
MNILQQNFKILENKTQKEYDIETNFDEISKLALSNFKERKKVIKNNEKKITPINERCIARVWGDGSGLKAEIIDGVIISYSQCKNKKIETGNFCKSCQKKSEINLNPLDKEKKGLRFGTINDDIPYKNSENKIEVVWEKNKDIDYSQYGMIWKNNKWRSHDYKKIVECFDERTKEYKYAKGKEIKIKDEDEEDK